MAWLVALGSTRAAVAHGDEFLCGDHERLSIKPRNRKIQDVWGQAILITIAL
jgi:hypothetical protein